jgi:outer membrane murein-binding lipoprotein Lpp
MRTLIAIFAACLLAGCSSIDPKDSFESKPVRELKPETVALLAEDFAAYLKALYKPAHDKFLMTTLPKKAVFGETLAAVLRDAGFAVAIAPQSEEGAIVLTYWLDAGADDILCRVTIAGIGTWARLYETDKLGGIVPRSAPATLEAGGKQ